MKRIYLFNLLVASFVFISVPAFGDEHKEGEDKKERASQSCGG